MCFATACDQLQMIRCWKVCRRFPLVRRSMASSFLFCLITLVSEPRAIASGSREPKKDRLIPSLSLRVLTRRSHDNSEIVTEQLPVFLAALYWIVITHTIFSYD